ncbi:MAG TPA: AraC family transcriptional regulator [Chthonomonadaceae bacterium]|nr:AraC family transcriptional regulator [Chthonomonadaceae bacterium]
MKSSNSRRHSIQLQQKYSGTPLPDHRRPALHTDRPTAFRWLEAGLPWPVEPCNFITHFFSSEVSCSKHPGLLSLKVALNGQEFYEVGRDQVAIDNDSYLILNDGQEYASRIESETPVESFAVFFSPDFAFDTLRSLITPYDQLLDLPTTSAQPVTFFQHRYDAEPTLLPTLETLRTTVFRGHYSNGWLEEQFHTLLEQMLVVHRKVRSDIDNLAGVRHATRLEIYQRANQARDYMEANLSRSLNIAEIASHACLSPHHFLRSFKQVFGETPHQYLMRRRLERARHLLTHTGLSITDICIGNGFESLGSFSWMFRQRIGVSPEAYRKQQRKIGLLAPSDVLA